MTIRDDFEPALVRHCAHCSALLCDWIEFESGLCRSCARYEYREEPPEKEEWW